MTKFNHLTLSTLLIFIISHSITAQHELDGAYLLENGEKIIVSGHLASDRLSLRKLNTGAIYKLNRIDKLHYESDNSLSAKINLIKCNFKIKNEEINSLEIIATNGKTEIAHKIRLHQEYSHFKSQGINLYGKLVLPQGEGPFPLVVIAQGSSNNSAIKRYHYPYQLAAEGLATFIYDKRGTGLSEGKYTQLFEVLSDDLVAAINSLEEHPKIDQHRIGLAGFSQGGWVAPLAALKTSKIKFIVIAYGLITSISEEDLLETPRKIAAMGFGKKEIKELKKFNESVHFLIENSFQKGWKEVENKLNLYKNRKWLDALKTTNTWSGTILQLGVEKAKEVGPEILKTFDPFYDPVPTLKKLNIPMLWLFGGDDIEAPSDSSIKRLRKLIKKDKKPFEMKIYPKTDHGMYEFTVRDKKRIYIRHPDSYLNDLNSWLKKQSNVKRPLSNIESVPTLALRGVNVIRVANNDILRNQNIIINKGVITDIYPNHNQIIKALKIIDASDKFVIPGLHDMHTHLETTALAKAIGMGEQFKSFPYEDLLAPYLANGITTIQVMSGGEDLLIIKDELINNKLRGPTIILGSPMIDGNPPILPEPFTKSIVKIADAAPFINKVKNKGYDFIKIRVNLSRPVFDEITVVAKKLDLPIIGHIPRGPDLSLDYALSKGNFGIAHIEEFGYDSAALNNKVIKRYISLLKENNTYIITTLSVFDNILKKMNNYEATLTKEKIKYVHPLIKGIWKRNPFKQEMTKDRVTAIKTQLTNQKKLIKIFYDAGIQIMAGTDALNPTIAPGFSLHREFELLIDAGLSPYEVLKMATNIPAKKITPSNEFAGTVRKGQVADLVVLDSNPLKDLSTLKKPQYVIKNGEILDKLDLQKILDKLEKKISE